MVVKQTMARRVPAASKRRRREMLLIATDQFDSIPRPDALDRAVLAVEQLHTPPHLVG